MEFKFYINGTEIDEPVGFDATKIKLKRSDNWHGVMAESSEETIEVYGNGFDILSGLYAVSGIDAVAVLKIEYYCAGELQDTIEYNITFYEYTEFCGSDCYCVVGIEKSGCFYQFKNAMDTKVDLDTLTAIDKTTELADYEYLGKEIEIPSKTIRKQITGNNDSIVSKDMLDDDEFGAIATKIAIGGISVRFRIFQADKIGLNEIPDSDINEDILYHAIDNGGDTMAGSEVYLFTNNNDETCIEAAEYNIKGKYKIKIEFNKFETYGWSENAYAEFNLLKIKLDNTSVVLDTATLTTTTTVINFQEKHFIFELDRTFDLYENIDIGEKIAMRVSVTSGLFSPDASLENAITKFDITQYSDSFINITIDSLCASTNTNAKLYLVNETLSHISEYVTNNCLKVYSEYLGRQDSQPFSFLDDGCGGMLGLTSGLFLRRIEDVKTDDNKPVFSLTFNEVINAVNCIYPLGFTIEQNGEDEVIRIEDWKYFYNDSIIADLGTVSVEKTPNLKLHFKNYKTGYSKYEAEEYNGLDEFLTEREYTTRLINHDAILERVCQFVASGYAIEITRRKGNTDSKDWRYDNDTFIICLDRYYGGLEVEQGNITNDANIIDPATILNFRISPARMALQWFQYVTTFLKSAKELIFSSGKGNTSAEGELISECSIDENVLSEKQNITQSDFILNHDGIFIPELHTISGVPFTFQQYKSLQSNPHGLFAYKCNETQLYGWLNECSYSFVEGTIDLVLIPKVI